MNDSLYKKPDFLEGGDEYSRNHDTTTQRGKRKRISSLGKKECYA